MNILLAIVVFGYLTAAQGSLQDSFAKTWQLTIKTDRQSFIVGESVPVTAELKNASIKKELLMLPFGTEWGLLAYAAEKNTEPVVHTSAKRLKAMASDKRPPPAVWIGPQAVVQTKIWLAYDVRQRTVVFPKPGSYTIFMRFPYEEGVKSNVLTIDVKEPSGSDAKALEFLQQNKLTAYLDPDGKRLRPETEEAAKLKEFIKLYGTSIYAPVLRFALRDSGLAAQLTIYPLAGVDFDTSA
ncbi:MAG: hypothetical protein HY747_11365 [Elusimicrobia bacterium]|nr:hypothetical protein [Elusimicrobiota bacterium]